jgi:hypothetical protein
MTTYEYVAALIAGAAVSVPIITWIVLWLIRRDRIFSNVAPGEIPADPDEAPTKFVSQGAHYWGEVEARSTPPAGVSPGLAGVVIDGSADGRDIAAMILDLARRGWLQLAQVSGTERADDDWAITRVDQPLDATLDLNEVHLITNLALPGATASLNDLCSGSDNRLGLVQLDLHREVVSRGWYPAAPNQTSDIPMAVLGVGGLLGLVIALIDVSSTSIGAGAVIIACAYLTSVIVRGGTPRTALGTAIRIQALGLRRYLEEAQIYQFSYTDALDTFRTYLPWAVVFELESQWAEIFAKLDVVAQTSELQFARDLRWFAGIQAKEPAVPPTVPVGGGATPRRGAYSEEDVVSTVLMSADQVAAEMTAAVAKVSSADASDVPANVSSEIVETVPAVRQWVPKRSSRPAVLQPRRKPPAPAVSAQSVPAAPVTPKRAPAVASAPATPTRTREPAAQATPAITESVKAAPAVREPRSDAAKFSDWLDEFDLAMTGDVEARDLESTDGGTVITGPERFDVLIAPPLWPDVPLDEKHTTRRAG